MLLSAEHLSINFGSRQLLEDVNFYLNEGDKVGVIGINGTGKSTFLKVLAGKLEADAGTISRNPNVQVSLLEQNPPMEDDATVLEQVFLHFPKEFRELNEYEAKSMLNKLGLPDYEQKVGTLSGGQRKRVALAAALIHPADVLVLDEPTNHLDIDSREALEGALEEYEGTMLIVTHDRYLVERLADRVLCMTESGIESYIGGYADYIAAKQEREAKAAAEKPAQRSQAGEDYRAKRERQSAINRASGELRRAEDRVNAAEEELSRLEEKLASPEVATNYVKAAELSLSLIHISRAHET